jgi:hypothetical protein
MESDFLELMTATVTIEPFLSEDEYTEPTFSPGYTVAARIEQTNREFRMPHGEVLTAQTVVYPYNPPQWITSKDRITLPDGSQPPCLGVTLEYDEIGFHHFEVFLGVVPTR